MALPFAILTGPIQLLNDVIRAVGTGAQYTSVTFESLMLHAGMRSLPVWVAPIAITGIVLFVYMWLARGRDESDLFGLGAVVSVAVLLAAPFAEINYFWGPAIWLILQAVAGGATLGQEQLPTTSAPRTMPAPAAP